ncbi:MAG: SpoIVB peptidase S55 domain-containing protein, partial [bacterium]
MKIKRLLGLWVLLTLFSALISAASLPNDVFPLGKVMPGMKGYGLTVFKGTKIERFNVTVLGVLPNQNNGRSLILIKMSGGPITQRQANIIGGMSGSPVFLNGKIVGAVAYGFGFPKEPQALVTPLQDMIEALDPMLPNTPSFALAPSGQLTQPVTVNGKYYT